MKESPLALPFRLALSMRAVDKLIANVDADPFTCRDRESIIALGHLRTHRDELAALARACREIRARFQGSPAPGTEVRAFSKAPSR
jgi:hypothetical protein